MTNLNPAARRQFIRRDHLLVGVPAVAGVLISLAVLVLMVQPARQRVGELETRVGDLRPSSDGCPHWTRSSMGHRVLSVVFSFSRVCWWI